MPGSTSNMAKKFDLKDFEKDMKKTQANAKKLLAKTAVKDPKKKKRAASIKVLRAAAKVDEL